MNFLLGFIVTWFLFIVFAALLYLGVTMRTEAVCLEKGYPIGKATWQLKQYCVTMEGATVEVEKL